MPLTLNALCTSAVTAAAVILVVVNVHREFGGSTRNTVATMPRQSASPRYIAGWEQARSVGITLGSSAAKYTVVEFADLECPFCRQLQTELEPIQRQFGDSLAIIFVHYPLEYHRFARPAARAAECADKQGAFQRFYSLVYKKQDSLGLKSWGEYASEASIKDTAAFVRCVHEAGPLPRVDAGFALGNKFGIQGTPALLLNGWMLRQQTPGPDSLVAEIIRSTRRPVHTPAGR